VDWLGIQQHTIEIEQNRLEFSHEEGKFQVTMCYHWKLGVTWHLKKS